MFLDLDKKNPAATAAIDDSGSSISYGSLIAFSGRFYEVINQRVLIFILADNVVGSMAGYVASLSSRIVPLLLSRQIDRQLLDQLIELYKPAYIWVPKSQQNDFKYKSVFSEAEYVLLKTNLPQYELNEHLSLLLPTSGSTGSPKLVRHSYENVEQNARNVAEFFQLDSAHRPIAILPMHYTMGLSVITSHLYAGSQILLMKNSLTSREFWNFVKEHNATSFTGVPFSFEVLHKLRFFRMDLPRLTLLTQGGGKLNPDLFRAFAEHAEKTGRKFIATYGQTEGTARMAWLPPEWATIKTCSIGKAIPNGELFLVDEKGNIITTPGKEGEMVYRGPNVTLGYATKGEDLLKGDENNGVRYTGDIAKRDADGFYYISGRKERFLKIYGFRVSLDEIEQMIKSTFNVDCLCMGKDDKMKVIITDSSKTDSVREYLVQKTRLFHKAFEIIHTDEIIRNEAGKAIYQV